jgi:8-oxo-dGTP pyrophosphatase MutT (NUDIX family)
MQGSEAQSDDQPRRGVVAVIGRSQRLLVIRRSPHVEAPGTYCFPGGAIEDGESPQEALRREFREELGADIEPLEELWHSVTPWNVDLAWWSAQLWPDAKVQPNPAEVDEVVWLTPDEMQRLPTLLTSNHQFLDAWRRGEFRLAELES